MARNSDGEIAEIWADIGDTAIPPVTFNEGWDITYSQTGGPKPERTSFNYLLKQLYAMGKDVSQLGASLPWSSTIDFLQDAIVSYDGSLYIALQASGPGGVGAQQPDTSPTYWSEVGGAGVATVSSGTGINVDNTDPANPIINVSGEILIVQDQKTTGTDGGAISSGSRVTRDLNTVIQNSISGASLSSNQITLPAGDYIIQGSAPSYGAQRAQAYFENITDATTPIVGTCSGEIISQNTNSTSRSMLDGYVSIASTKVFEVTFEVSLTQSSNGLGINSNHGPHETYTSVVIQKVG